MAPPIVVPCDADIRAAADVLNAGTKTVILAGQGALGAAAELEQLADLMAAPIVKPLLGKGGGARRLAVHDGRDRAARDGALRSGDGRSRHAADGRHELSVHGVLSETRRCRGVQIDRDPSRIGLRFPVEVGLCGDARARCSCCSRSSAAATIDRFSKRRRPA